MSPQAGWYADPTDPAAVRWWDGGQWTAETRPAPRELAMAGTAPTVATATATATPSLAPVVSSLAAPAPVVAAPVVTAPAVTTVGAPVAAPHVMGPAHVAPVADSSSATPTPSLVPSAGRHGTTAATPPPPLVTTYEPELAPVDRSRPGGGTAPAPRQPRTTTSNLTAAWVDDSLPTTTTGAPQGGFIGGGGTTGFGATGPSGNMRGGFSAGPSMDFSAVGHAGTPHETRHVGRTIFLLVLGLVLVAAFSVVAVPRYLAARAQGLAAEQPDVLSHSAPATLAGQKRAARSDSAVANAAKDLKAQGSTWAWAGSYGTRAATTSYLASDIPVDSRDEAVKTLTNHEAANELLASMSARVFPGGTVVLGNATEYASPVGGKTWCMQVTANGSANGYCVWTNGKEWLSVVASPGLETSAGKSALTALAQLAKITTKSAK